MLETDGWRVLEESRFLIPNLPPSVNSIYQILFHLKRVEMKPDVRVWKNQAKMYIPSLKALDDSFVFRLDAVFTYNWFYKNTKIRKFDSQNLLKVLCDAVAEKCGFRDELIKFGSWQSRHSEDKEWVECVLSQVTNEVKGATESVAQEHKKHKEQKHGQ